MQADGLQLGSQCGAEQPGALLVLEASVAEALRALARACAQTHA
ncbi:hypothetical protein ACFQ6E_38865 [Streptomyces sp. NPDC056462]